MNQRTSLIQQEEPGNDNFEQENFEVLSKKHENLIQLVIDEEEKLIGCQEEHINTTI